MNGKRTKQLRRQFRKITGLNSFKERGYFRRFKSRFMLNVDRNNLLRNI